MVRTRRREAWDHTSWLCAVIANHAFGTKRPRQPADFNPLVARPPLRKLSPKASLDLLERTFTPRSKHGYR
jgi:hypothetical protein